MILVGREVETIISALRELASALERLTGSAAEPEAPVSTRRRSQLRAQGYYVGALQRLSARDKSKVKATYKKEGVAAATKLAKSLAASK